MFFVFFFKQKTAYEMLRSLVGSEMCIRDRNNCIYSPDVISFAREKGYFTGKDSEFSFSDAYAPVSYTHLTLPTIYSV